MSAFTPGPWEFVRMLTASENAKGFFVRAAKPNGNGMWSLATVQPGDEDGVLGAHNARLIAAAPELYEALRECADRLKVHMKHTEDLIAHMQACKALEKAEGKA